MSEDSRRCCSRQGCATSSRRVYCWPRGPSTTRPGRRQRAGRGNAQATGRSRSFLLDRGANPNAAIVGYTALHPAALQGDLEVVEALLEDGASPNAQITQATGVARNGQVLFLGEHLLGATPFALAAKFIE